jgi:hypothetical protein
LNTLAKSGKNRLKSKRANVLGFPPVWEVSGKRVDRP